MSRLLGSGNRQESTVGEGKGREGRCIWACFGRTGRTGTLAPGRSQPESAGQLCGLWPARSARSGRRLQNVGGRRGWSAWVVGAVKQSEAASEAASEIERQKPRASPIATGSVTVRSPRGASREIEHGLRWVSRRGQGGRFGGFSDVVQDFVNDIWLSFCDEAQHTHFRATDGHRSGKTRYILAIRIAHMAENLRFSCWSLFFLSSPRPPAVGPPAVGLLGRWSMPIFSAASAICIAIIPAGAADSMTFCLSLLLGASTPW